MMAMFLIVGCQTTQSAETETKPEVVKEVKALPKEKEVLAPKKQVTKNPFKNVDIPPNQVVTSTKPVICGRIDTMIITVSGGREKQRSLIESIVSHMADRILGRRLSNAVYCNFQIISNLDADGWCEWMDDNLRPREFSVQIRKEQSYSQMILTVVHEMVHIRQMARSELYEIFRPRQMQVWKG